MGEARAGAAAAAWDVMVAESTSMMTSASAEAGREPRFLPLLLRCLIVWAKKKMRASRKVSEGEEDELTKACRIFHICASPKKVGGAGLAGVR